MTNQMNQMNRQQLFNLINTVSFAVDDLLLFLDTHPDDAEAIKAFHHYSDIRRNALQAYSASACYLFCAGKSHYL